MTAGILVIVGPTASGKKKLALRAAELFNGEIVSADSRKVYRYLDIGTAKPTPEDRAAAPHHLIDVVNPDEPFSAGEWVRLASEAVTGIISRGRLPIISGGTGFYIRAFRDGLTVDIAADTEIRKNLENECTGKGLHALYQTLAGIDPERASELHEHDRVRVLRALEVYYTTGRTFTEIRKNSRITGGDYTCYTIGADIERKELYRRIDIRVDAMVSAGLVDELRRVLDMGYSRSLTAFDTVGYKEWFPFLDGVESFESCLEAVKRDTRRYAKRQLTWFRSQPEIWWTGVLDDEKLSLALEQAGRWIESIQ
ncbi:tRNA (adenosine(37)-N6)-dimethylallyltransferase MiaA [bacterium]|nr:tRNA (adenosine(37)-N6)-dimethylallyltransferase MiaA [bacterium]